MCRERVAAVEYTLPEKTGRRTGFGVPLRLPTTIDKIRQEIPTFD